MAPDFSTGRYKTETKIVFWNTSITPSTHATNLRILMARHMNFDVHVNKMYKKVISHLLFINKVKDKFEIETCRIVIESIAFSIISYCLPIYGTTNNTLLRPVHQLQNFAAKICTSGKSRSDYATPFTTQLEWLKIDQKVNFDVAIHVFKVKETIS